MPFKDGKYEHETGFTIMVIGGEIMLSPNHPLSLKLSDMFDKTKWKEVK